MDLLVASINAVVVAAVGGIVAWFSKGRFDALDRKIDGVEARLDRKIDGVGARLDRKIDGVEAQLDGRIDSLGSRLDGRIDALQSSMDAMRSDLTRVALAVGVRPRAQND
jgi:hypothetical protein